jgi:phage baseplate assembly protein W
MSNISGLRFPMRFGPLGHLERVSGVDKIFCNLKNIVLTSVEERLMEPDFGSQAFALIFRNMDSPNIVLIRDMLLNAISRHEPRITVKSIRVTPDQDNGRLQIDTAFIINQTGEFSETSFFYEVP